MYADAESTDGRDRSFAATESGLRRDRKSLNEERYEQLFADDGGSNVPPFEQAEVGFGESYPNRTYFSLAPSSEPLQHTLMIFMHSKHRVLLLIETKPITFLIIVLLFIALLTSNGISELLSGLVQNLLR